MHINTHRMWPCCLTLGVMRAIIFDMDAVLVDTLPSHFQAMRTAVAEIAEIDLKERTSSLAGRNACDGNGSKNT